MRWRGRRQSRNVEDRRGRGRVAGAGLGLGGLLVILVVAALTGLDPVQLLQDVGDVQSPAGTNVPAGGGADDELTSFVRVVLADTEQTWESLFRGASHRYQPPTMVLFSGQVSSACGFNSAAVGPFYCPADRKVYLDLSFFHVLARQFAAPGDFAQAYVIAHEVGHHVQNQLGISDHVRQQQAALSRSQANELSVRLELQADCFAGVWGSHARGMLEPGDVEEGLRAAAAIGDDTIQRRSSGYTVPESWTHGSAEMRVRWLRTGLRSGDPDSCDTFSR